MPGTDSPILYSFRRCPYAIRARLAIAYAECRVALREVVLKDKPAAMLQASPKGTVPVLVQADGRVLDESLDILHWALQQRDLDNWSLQGRPEAQREARELIAVNDGPFKQQLDRYKYADRHPEQPASVYRSQAETLLQPLEQRLKQQPFLVGPQPSLADVAIFPFIRQFAHVDKRWFDQAPYPNLQAWLEQWLNSPLFARIMGKYPQWQPEQPPVWFPPTA